MPKDSKTYILDDQWTDKDALDFTLAWFDAWKYDKEESLWRAFLLCVLNALFVKNSPVIGKAYTGLFFYFLPFAFFPNDAFFAAFAFATGFFAGAFAF